jgi:LysR family transcriptional regulator, nitrogen assimilation regulatory protein
MDLRQLDYFVHVAELGSFSRAARMLEIAQSALSHRVRQLEVELKQPLLYRNGRGVTTTDAGNRLLVHARGILMQVNRSREELDALRGAPAGHAVLALPPGLARTLTVPLVKTLRARFPQATFGIMEGISVSIVEWVSSGRADIGLVFNPSPSPAIEIRPLCEDPMFLISGKDRGPRRAAVPLKDLPRYPLIVASRPNANRMRLETQLASHGLKPNIAMEIDGIASILAMVDEGYAHALLPGCALRGLGVTHAFDARPVVRPRLTMEVCVVISAQRPSTLLTQQVLAAIPEIALPAITGERSAPAG